MDQLSQSSRSLGAPGRGGTTDQIMPPGLCQNSRWEALRFLPLKPVESAVIKELIYRGRRGFSFPSVSLIARDTGYSVRSIQRGLNQLEALGLLRRVRRLRSNGTRGVYYYYLTFAGVIVGMTSGHPDENPPVTESAHNLKNKQLDSERLDQIIETEKCAFDILEPVLDLRRKPELIDGSVLTEWIFYRSGSVESQLDEFVLDQANQILALHQKHKTNFQDWQQFIELLEENAKAGSFEFAYGRVHPKLERRVLNYLTQAFDEKHARGPRLSQVPNIRSDSDGLILCAFNIIDYRSLSQNVKLLKGLANAIAMPVRVQFVSFETEPVYSKAG